MKNKILFLCAFLFATLVHGAANDMRLPQRNPTDTGDINRLIPFPAGGANGLLWFDGSTVLPRAATLGTNLAISSGVLNATFPTPDWAATTGQPGYIDNKPSFQTLAYTANWGDLNSTPTTASGYGISDVYTKSQVDSKLLLKADIGTTLAAYGILDAYTKTQVDTALSGKAASATTLSGYGIIDAYTKTQSDANYYPVTGNPSGFLTTVTGGQVTGALGYTPYNSTNPNNYISGISSGDITTALGFTPYNASNPSGYITNSALSPYLTSSIASSTYATQSSVTSGLATKFNTPAGSASQYVAGDGTLKTTPIVPTVVSAFTNDSGYRTQSQVRGDITLTTTGSGAASYNSGTGVLNVPTPAAPSAFTFGFPSGRTLSASTSYQATDPTKSAIIYPSYACQNATTVLAASGCTVQVRMHTSAVSCSTGMVYYTQSLTVNLGLLLTQNSTNPVPIFLPPGAYFIFCPTVGTFTVTTTEQASG